MTRVFHYPWRATLEPKYWRLPAPQGDVVSSELGAFVDRGDGQYVEIPGPTMREGVGQIGVFLEDHGEFLYSSDYSHQFQKESTSSFSRRNHFALTDAFIWLSSYLYRFREDSGSPLADRKLSDACVAFKGYLGSQKDFAPESLIVEIARNVPSAVASIVAGPRKVLTREHTNVPLDKIQEMDVFSLVDLARRPGRTVAMKAGPKQRLTALTRRETADTIENRVVLDFVRRSEASARQYVDEMCARCPCRLKCQQHDPIIEKDCPSDRIKIVAAYSRHCAAWIRSGAFVEVARLVEPRTRPNYVLQQNIRYVKVWKYYLRLLRLEDIEEDVWRWRRAAWSDFVKMLLAMVWEERLRPAAKIQTSHRPFMIRSSNRNGRWFVPTPFEDALVFEIEGNYKTFYLLATDDAVKLTGQEEFKLLNADVLAVVAAGGQFRVLPIWTFCPDVRCEKDFAEKRLASEVAAELGEGGLEGLVLFPSDDLVFDGKGKTLAIGLDPFSANLKGLFDLLEKYIKEALS